MPRPAGRRAPTYERRRPEETTLYRVVQQNLLTLCAAVEAGFEGGSLPKFVKAELDGFLGCGLLCRGFAHLRCADCDERRLVAFGCMGRGFCGGVGAGPRDEQGSGESDPSPVRAPHGRARGEQIAIERGDVDWRSRKVIFRRSSTRGVVGPTKSGRERKVPMTGALERALKSMRHLRSQLVFCDEEGKPHKLAAGRPPERALQHRKGLPQGKQSAAAVDREEVIGV